MWLNGPPGVTFLPQSENIGQEDKDRRVQVTNARQGTRHANEERIRATYAKEEQDAQQREAKKIAGKRRQREIYMTMLQESLETQM